jgi:hypothetical protein
VTLPRTEAEDPVERSAKASLLSTVLRIVAMVGALGLSFFVLFKAFDDLDVDAIFDTVTSFDDAEMVGLASLWAIWLAAQGLQTAALVRDLPVRSGVLAFLAPAAIASLIPGPSDLPVRHRMLRSWGRTTTESTVAVAAGGLFSIGIKLVLPIVAAIGLVVSDSPVEGSLRTIVTIAVIAGLGLTAAAFVFSSPSRTAVVGRMLAPVWTLVLRLLRRSTDRDLAAQLVTMRERAVDALRGRWLVATWGTVATAATRFGLLLMALRFAGVETDAVGATQAFVVYALVQGLTVVPLTAGDAGISELAYISMLTAIAGSDRVNEVTAGVLVFRVLTWLAIIPAGLVAMAVWRLSLRRQRRADATPT